MKHLHAILVLFACLGISNIACILNTPDSSEPPPQPKQQPKPDPTYGCGGGKTKVVINGEESCKTTCSSSKLCAEGLGCEKIKSQFVCMPSTCKNNQYIYRQNDTVTCLDYCDEQNPCATGQSCQNLDNTYSLCMPDTVPVQMDPCASDMNTMRCQADPASFDQWQPVSVLTNLQITSNITLANQIDLDNDQIADNAMGEMLSISSGALQDANDSLFDAPVAFVWEHQGINLVDGGPYTINFYRGTSSGGPAHTLSQTGIAQGVAAQQSAQATLTNDLITATAPSLTLEGRLIGVNIPWRLHHVSIEATIDRTQDPQLGLSLTKGKISGVIYQKELVDAYNAFFENDCACVQRDGQTVASPILRRNHEQILTHSCRQRIDASRCNVNNAAEQQCKTFTNISCDTIDAIAQFTTAVADDGQTLTQCGDERVSCQGISISLTFDAFKGRLTP